MAKRLLAFSKTLFNVTVALIAIPQFLFFAYNHSMMREAYEGRSLENLPAYVCLVTMLFSAYSFIRIEVTYNQPLRESFWENKVGDSLKSRLLFLVKQPEFWIKAFIIALIYVLIPLKYTLKPLVVVTQALSFADKPFCLAILLPTLLILAVLAHLFTYKRWGRNKSHTAYSKKEYHKETVSASMAYGGGAGAFLIAFPILAPIFILIYRSLTVRHIITIAILICLPFVYRFFRAIFKRRSFLRRLKEVCAEKGYTLSEIRFPYISLFMFLEGDSFTVTVGKKAYSCKLIPARKRNAPVVISESGHITYIYTISLRGAVLHQRSTTYKFGFDSENPKVLIVNPVPKQVYTIHAGKTIEIDNGAVVGGYKIFAATGFLRAAELNVLDR